MPRGLHRMTRSTRLLLCILLLCALAPCAAAAAHIKGIKLAVQNPTANAWPGANIVVRIADLRKIAPDFTPGSLIVTATDATSVEEDAAVLQTSELASQVDDLNNDNHADELVFQIDLKPRQTRIVTISYGENDRIW